MTRARSLLICSAIACFILVPAGEANAISASQLMIRKINSFRHAHHLRGLRSNSYLSRSSVNYARYMIRHDTFRHARASSAKRRFRRFGEVLEMHSGARARVAATLRAWRRSPGHRRVLLDRRVRYVGAGAAVGRFNGRRSTVWVVRVGRR